MFQRAGNSKVFSSGKGFFDKAWSAADKYIGEPMNRVAGKMGIEGVWPTTMDKECDKAARILRVFTLDGGVDTSESPEKLNVEDVDAKKKRQKVIKRIPAKALREAQGLAIFTVFRSGLGFSAASGSGVVIARKPDGSWGSPSGLLVHTLGFGFMLGIDVYDVVLILRTKAAVQSFARPKVNLGGELALVAGPLGGAVMADAGYQQVPCWSYVKSKGFYAGVQMDGSIIIERQDENARFYGAKYSAKDILDGNVHKPLDVEGLIQTIEAASDRDTKMDQIPDGLAPSEATGGKIDQKERPDVAQPAEGFGAPPKYEDLEEIKVRCSDCGNSMSMEELGLHDCSITQIRPADTSEKRRSVPPPPPGKVAGETPKVDDTNVPAATAATAKLYEDAALPSSEEHNKHVTTSDVRGLAHHNDLPAKLEEVRLDDAEDVNDGIEMVIADDDHATAAALPRTNHADAQQ
ncbi:protein of unknown function [Taphrina deformans PYCC 5710]|uniref:Ysc84 actin-binding domain-containing protein n=1 Tax=Taphrina deformans (strain PYCC 5710 / ATCC 11124 / CBS 356.35 / IMI 108563 / JCM 9778 / NBRC 8474) TaxID=1097556 RepID=R4XHG7_TAPDE|nr:protein of unknown function [Taphrina deformans PYCC 5710]|eukprot:CCG83973.1 protein of unknown function [Taphrina deformans PYCC 5710]